MRLYNRSGMPLKYMIEIMAMAACTSCGNCRKPVALCEEALPDHIAEEVREDAVSAHPYLIADNTAGPFRLGACVPQAVDGFAITEGCGSGAGAGKGRKCAVPVFTYEIGNEGWVKVVSDLSSDSSVSRIGEILVYSDLFATDKGIGAMSTIEEFASAYTYFSIRRHDCDMFAFVTPELRNVHFLLGNECYAGAGLCSDSDLPPAAELSDFKEKSCFTAVVIAQEGKNCLTIKDIHY